MGKFCQRLRWFWTTEGWPLSSLRESLSVFNTEVRDGRGKIISASEHKPSIYSRFWDMYLFPKLFSSYPCFHGALLVLAGLQMERLCKSRHRSDRTDKSTHTGIYTLHTDKDKDTETKTHTHANAQWQRHKDTQTHIHTQVTWLGV